MHFPNDINSLKEQLLGLPQQKIAHAVSLLLVIYIAFLTAKLTWLLLEPAPAVLNQAVVGQQQGVKKSAKVSTASVQKLNLFGDYNGVVEAPVVEQVEDAPETKLNLTLTGVVASSDVSTAAAIIEKSGNQETYGIGDTITGTRATLEKVFYDRVLINASGNLETLMLSGFDFTPASATATPQTKPAVTGKPAVAKKAKTKQLDHRQNAKLKEQAAALKADINNDPSKVIDYLRVSPKRVDGQIVGYRLRPGKKPEFFRAAGLKSGDVALEMNGFDLTNPLQGAQALQALKQESEISLLIDRNGEQTEILFTTN